MNKLDFDKLIKGYSRLNRLSIDLEKSKEKALCKNENEFINFSIEGEDLELDKDLAITIIKLISEDSAIQISQILDSVNYKDEKINTEEPVECYLKSAQNPKNIEIAKEVKEPIISKSEIDLTWLNTEVFKNIEALDIGDIVDAAEINAFLKTAYNIEVELYEINGILSKLKDDGYLELIYSVNCYKCSNNYSEILTHLPKEIICPKCEEDIYDITLQYRIIRE